MILERLFLQLVFLTTGSVVLVVGQLPVETTSMKPLPTAPSAAPSTTEAGHTTNVVMTTEAGETTTNVMGGSTTKSNTCSPQNPDVLPDGTVCPSEGLPDTFPDQDHCSKYINT